MGRSSEEIEREIAESRARLDATIERIQDRLTIPGLIDEVAGTFPGASPHRSFGGLVDQALETVRRHPIPLLIAAAGIGLLLQRQGAVRAARRAAAARVVPRDADLFEAPVAPRLRAYDPDDGDRPPPQDPAAAGREAVRG